MSVKITWDKEEKRSCLKRRLFGHCENKVGVEEECLFVISGKWIGSVLMSFDHVVMNE